MLSLGARIGSAVILRLDFVVIFVVLALQWFLPVPPLIHPLQSGNEHR
ncbi:hypothetical protein SynRCC2555_02151 [Synechococcus sp. WH 8101]|nr:hypothetical protein SynRCC2555_02151 [Synechococcus sp. WH 8101]